jgi:hypothetical protein
MNRTIEKALAQLTKEEREAIKTTCADQNEPAEKSLLGGGYRRDRHERDLTGLTPLEALAKAVVAGNRLLEIDYHNPPT